MEHAFPSRLRHNCEALPVSRRACDVSPLTLEPPGSCSTSCQTARFWLPPFSLHAVTSGLRVVAGHTEAHP